MLTVKLHRHNVIVPAGAWSSVGCGRRGDGLNWQLMCDDSHLCLITNRLIMCELITNRQKLQASDAPFSVFFSFFHKYEPGAFPNLPLHTYTPSSTVMKTEKSAYTFCTDDNFKMFTRPYKTMEKLTELISYYLLT